MGLRKMHACGVDRGFANHQMMFVVACFGVALAVAIPVAQDILRDKGYSLPPLLLLVAILGFVFMVAAALFIAALGFLLTVSESARVMKTAQFIAALIASVGYVAFAVTVFLVGLRPWLVEPLRRLL